MNGACGNHQSTALHCAASGGTVNAVQVVKLLLAAGADLDHELVMDVIVVPPKLEGVKLMLHDLLSSPTEFKNNEEYLPLPDIKNSVYATDEFRMYILSHRGRNPMFLLCIYLVAIYSQAGLDLLSTQDMFIRMSSIYVVGDYEQEQLLNDFR